MAWGPARAVEVTVTKIDGTKIGGEWLGSLDEGGIKLQTGDQKASLPLHDVSRVRFHPIKMVESSYTKGQVIFHLVDGGRLVGTFLDGQEESVRFDSALGENTSLAFDRLAGIQLINAHDFTRANELFIAALNDRLPGKDILITRDADDPKSLRGRLVNINPRQCSFTLSDKTRTVQTEKLYGLVFATGAQNPEKHRLRITLRDGSNMTGLWLRADREKITLITSFGLTLDLPIGRLFSLDHNSERIVYVSDLNFLEQHSSGRLHRSWPVRFNQNVAGKKISLNGRTFQKGLGCHSLSEVRYQLDGKYESFVSTIGIDDAVRPYGSVVFRVLGEGRKVLYESDLLRGIDPPQDIIVDVRNQKEMTLVVDFGDELDLSDYADWAGARLIKPTSAKSTGGL